MEYQQKNDLDNSDDIVDSDSYHPSYSSPEADLVLCSSDGVNFCVHTVIMSIASEVFKSMIDGATDDGETLQLQERSEILETMLNMIYPIGFFLDLPGKSFDFVWDLITAADKYEIKKILEEFRVRVIIDPHFQNRPLESYAIAVRCGWKNEIRTTSRRAIDSVHVDGAWDILQRIDIKMAIKLLDLPSRRRQFIIGRLPSSGPAAGPCLIKHLIERELYIRPSGDTLKGGFWKQKELRSLKDVTVHKWAFDKVIREKDIPHCVLQNEF